MSTKPFSRRRQTPEEDPEASSEETTTDSADETEELAPLPTGAELGPAPDHGDCAICHQPITSDQEYVQASYGLVHRDVCATQTHRT